MKRATSNKSGFLCKGTAIVDGDTEPCTYLAMVGQDYCPDHLYLRKEISCVQADVSDEALEKEEEALTPLEALALGILTLTKQFQEMGEQLKWIAHCCDTLGGKYMGVEENKKLKVIRVVKLNPKQGDRWLGCSVGNCHQTASTGVYVGDELKRAYCRQPGHIGLCQQYFKSLGAQNETPPS